MFYWFELKVISRESVFMNHKQIYVLKGIPIES